MSPLRFVNVENDNCRGHAAGRAATWIAVFLVAILWRGASGDAPGTAPATTQPADANGYQTCPASADGIGKVYMGREIAQVMGHLAAGWLERPEREKEEQPRKAIELIGFKPSDVVADIGAGTGYFSFRIAARVPRGKVLAEDIQPEMLGIVRSQAKTLGVKNVEGILGTVEDPKLPAEAVDVVLMVDAYHEFDHPREMMLAIVKSLKVGGRVVDVEYRGEDPDVNIKPHHKMTEAQARKEMAAVGLGFVKTYDDLPQQHLMVFQKNDPATQPATRPATP